MTTTSSAGPASLVRIVQNPLVTDGSDSLTAEAVANVLSFLAAVQPPDGGGLSDTEEMGRLRILHTCIGALKTIYGEDE